MVARVLTAVLALGLPLATLTPVFAGSVTGTDIDVDPGDPSITVPVTVGDGSVPGLDIDTPTTVAAPPVSVTPVGQPWPSITVEDGAVVITPVGSSTTVPGASETTVPPNSTVTPTSTTGDSESRFNWASVAKTTALVFAAVLLFPLSTWALWRRRKRSSVQ